jgi:hypothetical protein
VDAVAELALVRPVAALAADEARLGGFFFVYELAVDYDLSLAVLIRK